MRVKSAAFSSSPILSWHLSPWVSAYAALGQCEVFFLPSGFIHFVFNHFRLDFCLLAWVEFQRISRVHFPSMGCSYISVRPAAILSLASEWKINNELSVKAYPDWAGEMYPSMSFLPPRGNELSVEGFRVSSPKLFLFQTSVKLQFFNFTTIL